MLYVYGAPTDRNHGHETAHALLAHAYRTLAGGGDLPPMDRTEQGKPYFLRSPWEFSLTHARTMAFCAMGGQPLGVDAETVRPIRTGVIGHTMNDAEQAWIFRQEDRDRAFSHPVDPEGGMGQTFGQGLNGRPQDITLTLGRELSGCGGCSRLVPDQRD